MKNNDEAKMKKLVYELLKLFHNDKEIKELKKKKRNENDR